MTGRESPPEAAPSQSEIDRGEAPATTLRELSSAVRQNACAIGFDLSSLAITFERQDADGHAAAIRRLEGHILSIEAKLKLALGES